MKNYRHYRANAERASIKNAFSAWLLKLGRASTFIGSSYKFNYLTRLKDSIFKNILTLSSRTKLSHFE